MSFEFTALHRPHEAGGFETRPYGILDYHLHSGGSQPSAIPGFRVKHGMVIERIFIVGGWRRVR